MSKFISKVRNDELGATAIEYGLIAALVAVVAVVAVVLITALTALGGSLKTMFLNVSTAV